MMETARLSIRRFENTDFPTFAALIRDKMSDPAHIYDHSFPTDDENLRHILSYFQGQMSFMLYSKNGR